jgi:hypothetical protein
MVAFEKIAQQKIQAAMEAGEFDNLPNAGQPLDLDSYFALPAHLRMAYSVLKSANCVPEEVELLRETARLEAAYAAAADESARSRLASELERLRLRLAIALERHRVEARRSNIRP